MRRRHLCRATGLLVCALAVVGTGESMAAVHPSRDLRCVVGPRRLELKATTRAPGAEGYMEIAFARSPFGVTVAADGSYVYSVRIVAERLARRPDRHYVVWATTPNLDRVQRLGVLGEDLEASGQVDWNKFLVFITAETSADVERWQGPVLLTGMSPSGKMHTMAGHGIFEAHGGPC